MDYDERVGFAGRRKDKLGDRILWLHDARGSAAAHGNRRRREAGVCPVAVLAISGALSHYDETLVLIVSD